MNMLSRRMAPVEIEVKGISGSGKTSIATLIQQTLVANGFTSVVVINPEESAEARAEVLKSVLAEKDPDYFCKSITIVEKHLPTSSARR